MKKKRRSMGEIKKSYLEKIINMKPTKKDVEEIAKAISSEERARKKKT